MKRWKTYLGISAVFLSGAILGGVITSCYLHHLMMLAFESGPKGIRQHILDRMAHELDLHEEQIPKAKEIIYEMDREIVQIRREVQPRIEQIVTTAIAKGRAILEPDQQKRLEQTHEMIVQHWQMELRDE